MVVGVVRVGENIQQENKQKPEKSAISAKRAKELLSHKMRGIRRAIAK